MLGSAPAPTGINGPSVSRLPLKPLHLPHQPVQLSPCTAFFKSGPQLGEYWSNTSSVEFTGWNSLDSCFWKINMRPGFCCSTKNWNSDWIKQNVEKYSLKKYRYESQWPHFHFLDKLFPNQLIFHMTFTPPMKPWPIFTSKSTSARQILHWRYYLSK